MKGGEADGMWERVLGLEGKPERVMSSMGRSKGIRRGWWRGRLRHEVGGTTVHIIGVSVPGYHVVKQRYRKETAK